MRISKSTLALGCASIAFSVSANAALSAGSNEASRLPNLSEANRIGAVAGGGKLTALNFTPVTSVERVRPGYTPVFWSPPTSPAVMPSNDNFVEKDLWSRIRLNFAMPDLDSPTVDKQIQFYSARPQMIERTSLRGAKYLYHVVQELERRGLPAELALLPYVESSFNPNAVSTAKASGLWQFIPSTGAMYQLKQNIFKDERRDIVASTDAALTYLERLHNTFGDWQLALAAYNWGDGSVRRAIEKNRAAGLGTDYASLAHLMPAETRNYVPRLQAVKAIIADPERYGVKLPSVVNEPYFTEVTKVPRLDIATAAKLAEVPLSEFRALNPQFSRSVITGRDPKILLPAEKASAFKDNLHRWGEQVTAWTVHKVHSAREGVEAIAKRFGSTPEAIREANQIPHKMQVLAGSTILVPQASSGSRWLSDENMENAKLILGAERGQRKSVSKYPAKRYRQKTTKHR